MTPADLDAIAAKLTPGARRALMAMTERWRVPGSRSFNHAGAQSLILWPSYGALCSYSTVTENGRPVYRLTPLGLAVKAHIEKEPTR